MCTVTYLPGSKSDYTLVSSRDESPTRGSVSFPVFGKEGRIAFPKDEAGGGTWVASTSFGRTVCLLNGAGKKHDRHPPYRISRGQMVVDFFDYPTAEAFARAYNFYGIEPFTLVVIERDSSGKRTLTQLRWNEMRVEMLLLNPEKRYIWSSVTLYDDVQIEERKRWFKEWYSNNLVIPSTASEFHKRTHGNDPYYDIIMKRDGVETVSVTTVRVDQGKVTMLYDNFDGVREMKFDGHEVKDPEMV